MGQISNVQKYAAPVITSLLFTGGCLSFLISDQITRLITQGTIATLGTAHILIDQSRSKRYVEITGYSRKSGIYGTGDSRPLDLVRNVKGRAVGQELEEQLITVHLEERGRRYTWTGSRPTLPDLPNRIVLPRSLLPEEGRDFAFRYDAKRLKVRLRENFLERITPSSLPLRREDTPEQWSALDGAILSKSRETWALEEGWSRFEVGGELASDQIVPDPFRSCLLLWTPQIFDLGPHTLTLEGELDEVALLAHGQKVMMVCDTGSYEFILPEGAQPEHLEFEREGPGRFRLQISSDGLS